MAHHGSELREQGWPAELYADMDEDGTNVTVSLRIPLSLNMPLPVEAVTKL